MVRVPPPFGLYVDRPVAYGPRAVWYRDVYLKSDAWLGVRDAVLRRAGGLCERCLKARRLEVHHKVYPRDGVERLEDLEALCRPCRRVGHGFEARLLRRSGASRLAYRVTFFRVCLGTALADREAGRPRRFWSSRYRVVRPALERALADPDTELYWGLF